MGCVAFDSSAPEVEPGNAASAPAPAETYRSPLLGFPGAVAADDPDVGVAWHYGDPIGEQRAAERGAALFDLSHRGIIAVSGPDRLTWLNTLTSQLLSELPAGGATQALVLSPNGHVEHHFYVTEVGGVTYLDTEPATATALLAYLDKMVFWSKVEVNVSDLAQLRHRRPERRLMFSLLSSSPFLALIRPSRCPAADLPGGRAGTSTFSCRAPRWRIRRRPWLPREP